MVGLRQLVVAGGDGAMPLVAAAQPFDRVALAVGGAADADPAPRLGRETGTPAAMRSRATSSGAVSIASWPVASSCRVQPGVAHTMGFMVYGAEYERRILDFLAKVDWDSPPDLKAPERTLEGLKVS